MINGSLINDTSFEDYFPELTWAERGVVFVFILAMMVISIVGNTFVLIMSKDLKVCYTRSSCDDLTLFVVVRYH